MLFRSVSQSRYHNRKSKTPQASEVSDQPIKVIGEPVADTGKPVKADTDETLRPPIPPIPKPVPTNTGISFPSTTIEDKEPTLSDESIKKLEELKEELENYKKEFLDADKNDIYTNWYQHVAEQRTKKSQPELDEISNISTQKVNEIKEKILQKEKEIQKFAEQIGLKLIPKELPRLTKEEESIIRKKAQSDYDSSKEKEEQELKAMSAEDARQLTLPTQEPVEEVTVEEPTSVPPAVVEGKEGESEAVTAPAESAAPVSEPAVTAPVSEPVAPAEAVSEPAVTAPVAPAEAVSEPVEPAEAVTAPVSDAEEAPPGTPPPAVEGKPEAQKTKDLLSEQIEQAKSILESLKTIQKPTIPPARPITYSKPDQKLTIAEPQPTGPPPQPTIAEPQPTGPPLDIKGTIAQLPPMPPTEPPTPEDKISSLIKAANDALSKMQQPPAKEDELSKLVDLKETKKPTPTKEQPPPPLYKLPMIEPIIEHSHEVIDDIIAQEYTKSAVEKVFNRAKKTTKDLANIATNVLSNFMPAKRPQLTPQERAEQAKQQYGELYTDIYETPNIMVLEDHSPMNIVHEDAIRSDAAISIKDPTMLDNKVAEEIAKLKQQNADLKSKEPTKITRIKIEGDPDTKETMIMVVPDEKTTDTKPSVTAVSDTGAADSAGAVTASDSPSFPSTTAGGTDVGSSTVT